MKKKIPAAWLAVVIWLAVMFGFSAQSAAESYTVSYNVMQAVVSLLQLFMPDLPLDPNFFHQFLRKYAHFLLFMGLGGILAYAVNQGKGPGRRRVGLPLLLCFLLAFLDEAYKLLGNDRGFDLPDVAVDTAGAAIGIGLYWLLAKRRKRLKS